MAPPQWRIDELAQRSGLTVDTIRYYAREGLLMAPEREGRHKLYGPEHLDRLTRIRELQEQRFSLAAIRALITADRPGIEDLFTSAGRTYTAEDLVARSHVDEALVNRLIEVGLIVDPRALQRDAYDDSDLAVLKAVAELVEIGMTADVVVALGEIYVRHFMALQRDVYAMLAGEGLHLDAEALVAIQRNLTANAQRMMPAVDRVLEYVHQRTVQRLTLDAIRNAQATGTGVGDLREPPGDHGRA